jgi:hypothetical protein
MIFKNQEHWCSYAKSIFRFITNLLAEIVIPRSAEWELPRGRFWLISYWNSHGERLLYAFPRLILMKERETYVFISVLFSYALMRSSLRVALPMSAPLSLSFGGLTHRIDRERGGRVSCIYSSSRSYFLPQCWFCVMLSTVEACRGWRSWAALGVRRRWSSGL